MELWLVELKTNIQIHKQENASKLNDSDLATKRKKHGRKRHISIIQKWETEWAVSTGVSY